MTFSFVKSQVNSVTFQQEVERMLLYEGIKRGSGSHEDFNLAVKAICSQLYDVHDNRKRIALARKYIFDRGYV